MNLSSKDPCHTFPSKMESTSSTTEEAEAHPPLPPALRCVYSPHFPGDRHLLFLWGQTQALASPWEVPRCLGPQFPQRLGSTAQTSAPIPNLSPFFP